MFIINTSKAGAITVIMDEMQNETERDTALRFSAEQYVSNGYYMHFHRNIEIYGVVSGTVSVTVAGRQASEPAASPPLRIPGNYCSNLSLEVCKAEL